MSHRLPAKITLIAVLAWVGYAAGRVAGENPGSLMSEWGTQLELDPRVVEQIEIYSQDKDDLGEAYASLLAPGVRRLVFAAAVGALDNLPSGPGEPHVDVSFLEAGFAAEDGKPPLDEHQREFEEGFIRTEVLAFIEANEVTPETALRMYTSPEFRMDVSSRIKRIWEEGELSCYEVKGVAALLSPTMACNRIDEFVCSDIASEHSQVVANPGGEDYQTVYFKESLKTFIVVPGGLALHYINYTRAVKLGSIKRKFGRGKIAESEVEKIRELESRFVDEN
jgi:hypothetical protein